MAAVYQQSLSNPIVGVARYPRAALSVCIVALLAACGGGGGSSGSESAAPVALGAALPEQGNYLAISQSELTLSEASRTGSVSVARHGMASGTTTVQYRLVSGTAVAGEDFRAAEGQLQWSDGDAAAQSIQFVVDSDVRGEGVEDFYVELFNVTGNESLGVNDRAVVHLQDSDCAPIVPQNMSSDTKLSAPCYQLKGTAKVGGSAQLEIGAGTNVIANEGASLLVADSASLFIQGSSELPAVVKGAEEEPGYWQGMSLLGSSVLHRVEHAEIGHAYNALSLVAGTMGTFGNTVFHDNAGAAISLPMHNAETLNNTNTFTANTRGVELTGSSIAVGETVTLPEQSTHYTFASGIVNSGKLVIEAGADVRMAADVNVLVLSTGSVNAVGTAEKPIMITGLESRPGYWNGLQYVSSASSDNQFEHVILAHGGGDPARSGNIIVDGLGTAMALRSCVISHSAGHGIVYDSSSFQVDLETVVFEHNRLGDQSL